MPTPIRGQSITAPPKVDATLSNISSNTVQNQAVANALAGAYDATATYAVGDLCIHDGILYECTIPIATAEVWDATHWKTRNFGDTVSDLNRQLSDLDDDKQDAPSTAGTAGQVLALDDNLNPVWANQSGGGGGGTSDYSDLTNKPSINGHILTGDQSASNLGLATPSDIPTVLVQSVNGKTGEVALNSGDIEYDGTATYQSGTVGAELQNQTRQLSDLDDDKQDAPVTAGTAGQVLGLDSNLNPAWVNQSGGGVSDYTQLTNKPQINSVTLTGNKSLSDIGAIAAPSSPATGAFLVWNGTAWVAQTLATWQGGSY